MTNKSTVSIVITTYYRNDTLERAVESCLAQTCDPIEVIVVDDSGERHAADVCAQWEDVEYVPHSQNKGQIAAWHTGFDTASGEYVQFLDDDDELSEEKITKQVALLESSECVGAVGCGIEWDFGATSLPDERLRENPLEQALMFQTFPCTTSTLLFDRAILEDVLPLKEYRGATDLTLWIEFASRTSFDYINEALVRRRSDGYSKGESWDAVEARQEMVDDYAHLYDEVPDDIRKRAKGEIYLKVGHRLLDERIWSLKAIISFVRSYYYAPSGQSFKLALLSLLGRYGRVAGRKVSQIG